MTLLDQTPVDHIIRFSKPCQVAGRTHQPGTETPVDAALAARIVALGAGEIVGRYSPDEPAAAAPPDQPAAPAKKRSKPKKDPTP